ncbi:MAG: polysaccharide deacetylase family protein [Candidatus Hydrogenedentota bacterium]
MTGPRPFWWKLAALGSCAGIGGDTGPWILLYHRVAPEPHHGGETTPENFNEHLDLLRSRCDCLSLSDLLRRCREGRATGREATITFDDGYRDQAAAARRAMAKGVHATIFIPSSYPESGRNFFWEGRDSEECERIKDQMRRGMEPPEGLETSDVMSWAEIAGLVKEGIGIESHAHSHRILSGLPDPELKTELLAARREFEAHLDRRPEVIAYPNGDWNDFDARVDRSVDEAGFAAGVTAVFGAVRRAQLPWRIRRLGVANQSAESLEQVLRGGHAAAACKAALDHWRGRR